MTAPQVKQGDGGQTGGGIAAIQQWTRQVFGWAQQEAEDASGKFQRNRVIISIIGVEICISSQNEIDRDEAEKQKLEAEVAAARERLEVVENRLALKTTRMENYDKAIVKSEAAYLQILESSQVTKSKERLVSMVNQNSTLQVLLSVVKKETKELTKDTEEE